MSARQSLSVPTIKYAKTPNNFSSPWIFPELHADRLFVQLELQRPSKAKQDTRHHSAEEHSVHT